MVLSCAFFPCLFTCKKILLSLNKKKNSNRMEVAPVPVLRPSYLMDQEEFQGDLVEAPSNIFYQKVNASRATERRLQFQWRSPSDNLLASPVMFLRMVLKITCPQLWTQVQAYINTHGVLAFEHAGADITTSAGVGAAAGQGIIIDPANHQGTRVPSICFADADGISGSASSINFLFNGTSLGLNRTNRWFRDFTKCMISSDDAAKIYKSSGGRFDQKDQKGCAGIIYNNVVAADGTRVAHNALAAAGGRTFAGITQDTGVSDRARALFSLLQGGSATVAGDNAIGERYLQVSWPVCVSPFNPWRAASVPASCPYRKGPLAIPHLSAGGLDLLLEDFEKCFIRRLGRTRAINGAGGANIGTGNQGADLGVKLVTDDANFQPYLEIKYFRLSHTRALKEGYRWNCWQAQTFQGPVPPSQAGQGHVMHYPGFCAMPPIGKDVMEPPVAQNSLKLAVSMCRATRAGKEWDINFDVINLAQIPSYLLISVPKLADCYSLGSEIVDPGQEIKVEQCMRNLDNNLSIKNLKIIVNSARGALDKSADDTGFVDAERLWEMTKENANSEYFKHGGFRAWRDYGCCVLLSSSQFAPGMQACDGVSYPVQIQVQMTVQNRAVDVLALGIQGKLGTERCHQLSRDFIRARAQVTALFSKLILSTTETSASTNYMSYPLDSAERLMNNAGAFR
jgi:hypothetical protein